MELSLEIKRDQLDEHGRATIPDHVCAEAVPSGYGTRYCTIVVDGKPRRGRATYGRYMSYITIPSMARKESAHEHS